MSGSAGKRTPTFEKAEIRIVAGSLKGRKITVQVAPTLRPTPQAVRESLFSILGNAVPNRLFVDLYAGTGVVGFEAISRGAKHVWFVERNGKQIDAIQRAADRFGVARSTSVVKASALQWTERWIAPAEPVTVFFSPPFPDLADDTRPAFNAAVADVIKRIAPDSVVALQVEGGFPYGELPHAGEWDIREYGRNVLCFWVKPLPASDPPSA
ncbi:MAG: RsmD family RNA methyltransferase [Gemmataceae bacterium]